MAEPRPLLTIAIPTYNRSALLAELLAALAPQLQAHPDAELLISDNASPDGTAAVVERFSAETGVAARYHRQPTNIGSDANFIFCFEQARGRYLWICGDDDVLVPTEGEQVGALDQLMPHLRRDDYDLVYATSYPFRRGWREARRGDPLGRQYHVIRSPRRFMRVTNVMFTFISGMVVNKDRFLALQRDTGTRIVPPSEFLGSNLPQLSWTLPLLRTHRQSLVLWQRPVAGRQGNASGYGLGQVFGAQLVAALGRTLPDRPDLAAILLNVTLRRWLPSTVYDLRARGGVAGAEMLRGASSLRVSYGANLRYWLFAWPVLRLPLPLARVWLGLGAAVSKLLYALEVPGFWRRVIPAAASRKSRDSASGRG